MLTAILDPWLAELQGSLGPFPMPRGLSVVLTRTGGGMEHSTVARTYRDSWWDEAIDMWYELSADPAYALIRYLPAVGLPPRTAQVSHNDSLRVTIDFVVRERILPLHVEARRTRSCRRHG